MDSQGDPLAGMSCACLWMFQILSSPSDHDLMGRTMGWIRKNARDDDDDDDDVDDKDKS